MKLLSGNHRLIISLQLIWQYLLLGWFALVTVLFAVRSDWARGLAVVGVWLIMGATVTVVAGLGWQFKREGHRRGVWWCGVLLLLLALAVAIRFIGL